MNSELYYYIKVKYEKNKKQTKNKLTSQQKQSLTAAERISIHNIYIFINKEYIFTLCYTIIETDIHNDIISQSITSMILEKGMKTKIMYPVSIQVEKVWTAVTTLFTRLQDVWTMDERQR